MTLDERLSSNNHQYEVIVIDKHGEQCLYWIDNDIKYQANVISERKINNSVLQIQIDFDYSKEMKKKNLYKDYNKLLDKLIEHNANDYQLNYFLEMISYDDELTSKDICELQEKAQSTRRL